MNVCRKKAGVRGAGNFVGVMEAYLLRKNCGLQDGDARQRNLTVGDVNNRLDKLAATESREEQVGGNSRLRATRRQHMWNMVLLSVAVPVCLPSSDGEGQCRVPHPVPLS